MDLDTAAATLAQLGNRHRLEILRLLVQAGPNGLIIGEIQEHLDIPASTLAFHLRGLVQERLVEQTKEARSVRCRAAYRTLDAVLAFVKQACCAGVTPKAVARTKAKPAA